MRIIAITILLYISLTSCENRQPRAYLTGIDISYDDRYIVFSANNDTAGAVFRLNLEDGAVETICYEREIYFSKPMYGNNNRLFFAKNNIPNSKGTLFCVDSVTQNIHSLLEFEGITTELVENDSCLVLNISKTHTAYSPIASKSLHDFDLYEYNYKKKSLQKITSLNAYALGSLSTANNMIAFRAVNKDPGGGIFMIRDKRIESLNPVNNPRTDSTLYYDPVILPNSSDIFFTAPYELYRMGKDKQADLVCRTSSNIKSIALFKHSDRIAYLKEGNDSTVFIMDHSGKQMGKFVFTSLGK